MACKTPNSKEELIKVYDELYFNSFKEAHQLQSLYFTLSGILARIAQEYCKIDLLKMLEALRESNYPWDFKCDTYEERCLTYFMNLIACTKISDFKDVNLSEFMKENV